MCELDLDLEETLILELEIECDQEGRSSATCAYQVMATARSVWVSTAYNEEIFNTSLRE